MRTIKFALLLGIIALYSCKPTDPQADLLSGAWKLVALKLDTDKDWQKNAFNPAINVIFGKYGVIYSTENNMLFSGGWCNKAERYSTKAGIITFEFGEAKCIPFVNREIPVEAKIIDVTTQNLLIEWDGKTMKFERIN